MDPRTEEENQPGLFERFQKSWFPPAAVLGAFTAFVAAAFRVRPEPKAQPRRAESVNPSAAPQKAAPATPVAPNFERRYSQSMVLGGSASSHPFKRSLSGVAAGATDQIHALGDDEVRIFDPSGRLIRAFRAPEKAVCLTAAADGRVFVGAADRVEIFDGSGNRLGGFAAGSPGNPAEITAIKVFAGEIFVADAGARLIWRYDAAGKLLGDIGGQSKAGKFILPNRSLDIDVDSKGIVRATDTGRHKVTAWSVDGSPLGSFGKFGMTNPEDFVGCCNPVNIAVAPDGSIVTGEKMVARVKVFTPEGKLLAVIGPENFDPLCTHIHLAVDSKGRILAADPVRREIKVFVQVSKIGWTEPISLELERA